MPCIVWSKPERLVPFLPQIHKFRSSQSIEATGTPPLQDRVGSYLSMSMKLQRPEAQSNNQHSQREGQAVDLSVFLKENSLEIFHPREEIFIQDKSITCCILGNDMMPHFPSYWNHYILGSHLYISKVLLGRNSRLCPKSLAIELLNLEGHGHPSDNVSLQYTCCFHS